MDHFRTLSIHFGQPPSISNTHFDTQLPLMVDDEMILRTDILEQRSGTIPETAFFVYAMQLTQVLEPINTSIYISNNNRPSTFNTAIENGDFSLLKKFESALVDWHESVPPELKIDNLDYPSPNASGWSPIRRQTVVLYLR